MKKWRSLSGIIGGAGLAVALLMIFINPDEALFSYLSAFMYWLGLSLGAMTLLMVFHAAKARWPVAERRIIEIMASAVWVFAILFIPIAAFLKKIYFWVDPPWEKLSEEVQHALHHKHGYLNTPFFFARALIYFGLWFAFSHFLTRWSVQQDQTKDNKLTVKMWKLGPAAIPPFGFALTFAAFDWIMSLHPTWYSTMFGVYYFAGSFVATIAFLIVVITAIDKSGAFGSPVPKTHYHNWGKFLLAFTCFWAYIGFSQFMLIWIANLPHEGPWYQLRMDNGWGAVGALLIVGHFVVPFLILLSAQLKKRPERLRLVALWILFIHFVDVYWMIAPASRPTLMPKNMLTFVSDLAAFVGVGGIAATVALTWASRRSLVPVGDPYLAESLAKP